MSHGVCCEVGVVMRRLAGECAECGDGRGLDNDRPDAVPDAENGNCA